MPTVEIYQRQVKIKVETFKRDFYIMEDNSSGEIFWDSGAQNRVGVIKSWIQCGDTNPQIRIVLPDWQLTINGAEMERKFYDEVVDLTGQRVELAHGDYKFVFRFDKTPSGRIKQTRGRKPGAAR